MTLLLLTVLCGCEPVSRANTGTVPVAESAPKEMPEAEPSRLTGEPEETVQYRLLYSKDGYTGYDKKYFFLQSLNEADAGSALSVNVTILRNEEVIAEETKEVTSQNAAPILLCDLSALSDNGDYTVTVRIEPEEGPAFSMEEQFRIFDGRYREQFFEACHATQPSPSVYACADQILAYELTEDEQLAGLADSAKLQMTETLETYYNATPDDSVRLFTTAWLYKETGDKRYRKEAESCLEDLSETVKIGEDPALFWGIAAYLRTTHPTDYNLCEKAMRLVFAGANEILKLNPEAEWERLYREPDEVRFREAGQKAGMLMLANNVSNSAEYVRCAGNYLSIAGNPTDSLFVLSELSRVPL